MAARAAALVALVALAAPHAARADTGAPAKTSAPANADPRRAARLRSARIQRDLGWGLAGTGVAAIACGIATVVFGFHDERGYTQGVVDVTAGAATTAVGLALAIPGVVLALRGQDRIADALWLRTVVTPAAGGVVGGLRISF